MNRERKIEEAIIADTGALGFPNALVIRNVRVTPDTGRVDLMLLPTKGPKQLVLLEAKHAASSDSASKVIGQLLMYWAGALQISHGGLARIRRFAKLDPELARSPAKKSIVRVAGVRPTERAWALLRSGRAISPDRIALYVAFNSKPAPSLVIALDMLRSHYGLDIRVVVANSRGVLVSDAPLPPTLRPHP